MDLLSLDGAGLDNAMSELTDPAKYKGYLQTLSYFSSYSRRNIFLIYKQMPHASKLADFNGWKEQYGRTIIKGSMSIKINIPIEQKPIKRIVEKIDPTTGKAALDESGKRIMEDITVEAPVKFKQSSYFDISQTEGNPVLRLAGDVMTDEALRGVFTDALKTMVSSAVFHDTNSEQIDIYGIIKEIVLDRLGDSDADEINFIIESIAFAVCRRFGVETDRIEFDLSEENRIDTETLDTIGKHTDDLITAIEDRFAVVCKERGLDPMTLIKPAEPKPKDEPKAVSIIEPQAKPQYKKELRIETVAGVEFSQYTVKTLTEDEASETDSSAPPPSAEQTTEILTPPEPPAPQQSPKKHSIPKEPIEPPILKYPPDTSITIAERNQYGYTRPELLPLNKERAITLFRRDMTVYLLNKDNTEAMARYVSDIQNHNGIFGVAYGNWQNSREYIALASGNPEAQQEAKFIFDGGDSFAVYQTEPDESPAAYKSYEELVTNGFDIDRRNYNLVYTALLPAPPSDTPSGIFMWVNAERLDDYKGRALAISDVLSIKKDELITSYYANGRIFKELLSFTGEEGRKIKREIEDAENVSVPVEQKAVQEKHINETVISNHQATIISIATEPPQPLPQAEPQIITPVTEILPSEEPPVVQSPPLSVIPPSPPALPEIRSEVSVYKLSVKKAEEYGAMEAYDLSRRTDIDCAEAITEAIQAHKTGENRYDLTTPSESLLKRYGTERMKWVLSKHILFTPKRFSKVNYTWAKEFVNDNTGSGDENPTFIINIHYTVLDAFVNQIRAILSKKPSFIEKMKEAKKKSEAHNNSSG